MSKKISLSLAIVLILLAILLTFQITFVTIDKKYKKAFEEISSNANMYEKLSYVDNAFRSVFIGELDDEALTDAVISAYIGATGDKHSYYLNKRQYASFVADNIGENEGIGVTVAEVENGLLVLDVVADSPAFEAGIKNGDTIIKVEGTQFSDVGYEVFLDLMLGKADTIVNFTVLREETQIDFSIKRAVIKEISVYGRILEADATVGVVRILEFDGNTANQFKTACDELIKNGVTAFIFDVRNNPGGDLEAVCEVLDYLLPKGPIIRMYDKEKNESIRYSEDSYLDMPMCVLVNEHTASAAELFSCSLRDYGLSELVGTKTYGKGTVQGIIELPDGSGFGISNRYYLPPYSESYHEIGISPDYVILPDETLINVGINSASDSEDNQLLKAVEVLNLRRNNAK